MSNRLQIAVNALETQGAARSLAEPNLVTLSGETASFLAGGQIPIPEVGATGTPSFGFQPYGVGLSFTPTVLRDGLINLVVKPEVSELDPVNGVTVAGTFVPGLTTRKAATTLELRDGQSFMLGGLLQNTNTNAQDQLPYVGDVPVLGALFRSTDYQKSETDLVILVTPHIVRPMTPTEPAHSPLDNTLPPNDTDLFLKGKTEVSPESGAVRRRRPEPSLCRPYPRPAAIWRRLCIRQKLRPCALSRVHVVPDARARGSAAAPTRAPISTAAKRFFSAPATPSPPTRRR